MSEAHIPKQIMDNADAAEELLKQMLANESEEIPEDDNDPTSDDEGVDGEVEEAEEVGEDENSQTYKQRFSTLQGKYNAEVLRVKEEMQALKEQLNASKAPAQTEKPVEEEDVFGEFAEEYGDAFAAKMRKFVEKMARQSVAPYEEKLTQVENKQITSARDTFMGELDSKADGWRELWEGKDAGFMTFLNNTDPSGLYTYGELVQMYNNSWDSDKLAKVFNLYKESKVQEKPTGKSKPNAKQEAMVAPSRTTPTATPTGKSDKIWTAEDIKKFQKDEQSGKYSKAEAEALWEDMIRAPSEGRVR